MFVVHLQSRLCWTPIYLLSEEQRWPPIDHIFYIIISTIVHVIYSHGFSMWDDYLFIPRLFSYSLAVNLPLNVDSFLPASSFLLWFLFMSGGDRDEGEDTAGDLRRTESDSVLKKVSFSPPNYSWLWSHYTPTPQWELEAACGGAFVLHY